jgi:hypothetical protein
MKLRGGEVAVVRGKDGRFRVTIPKDLALALGLEGGERGKFRLLRLSSTQVVLSLEIARAKVRGPWDGVLPSWEAEIFPTSPPIPETPGPKIFLGRTLEARGIPTKRGGKWAAATVRKLLSRSEEALCVARS